MHFVVIYVQATCLVRLHLPTEWNTGLEPHVFLGIGLS